MKEYRFRPLKVEDIHDVLQALNLYHANNDVVYVGMICGRYGILYTVLKKDADESMDRVYME